MDNGNSSTVAAQLGSSYLTVSNPHDSQGYLQPINQAVKGRVDSQGYEKPLNSGFTTNVKNDELDYDEVNGVWGNNKISRESQKIEYNLYDQINDTNYGIVPTVNDNIYEKPVNSNHLYQELTRPEPTAPVLDYIDHTNNNHVPVPQSGSQEIISQPVTVVIAVPTRDESYKPSKHFTIMTIIISVIHIVFSVMLISLQILLDIHNTPLSKPQMGLILGIFSGVIGILGILAYKSKFTKRGVPISMIVLSIFCILLAFALLIVSPLDLILTALQTHPNRPKGDPFAANGILILLAFLEIVFGIWSSVIACIGTCKCCKLCCYYIDEEAKNNHIQASYNRYAVQDKN